MALSTRPQVRLEVLDLQVFAHSTEANSRHCPLQNPVSAVLRVAQNLKFIGPQGPVIWVKTELIRSVCDEWF